MKNVIYKNRIMICIYEKHIYDNHIMTFVTASKIIPRVSEHGYILEWIYHSQGLM